MSHREPRQEQSLRQRDWDDPDTMLGVDEARERILRAFQPLDLVSLPIIDALDLVLGEDIVATDDIPPFRNSAMDGYAVRASDTTSASESSPIRLTVVSEIAAGQQLGASHRVNAGEAARIMTGAVMPHGADAVVRFEETDEGNHDVDVARANRQVVIFRAVRPWDNVRERGEDIRAGSLVMPAGRQLRPADIGVLASLNRSRVRVFRRPRVAILSTGDEVVDLGEPLRPGQIRNSNSYTIAAMTKKVGGEPVLLGVAGDHLDAIRARLREAIGADILVTSGGVSYGDYDVVKDVLQAEGNIDLWQVRIKPGKPMAFGHVGGTPLLGLPGNPVAAVVAFTQFGVPALRKMLGFPASTPARLRARLLHAHENRGRRRHFVRGMLERQGDEYVVQATPSQGSGVLTSMTQANCFIIIPETWDQAPAGSVVDVELLDAELIL